LKTKDVQTLFVISTIYSKRGFHITNDEKADCRIELTGFITAPSKTSGSVPIDITYMLDNQAAFKDVAPALKSKDMKELISSVSGIVGDPLNAGEMVAVSQAGGVIGGATSIGGTSGTVIGAGVGTLVNMVSGIQSRLDTPPGLVYVHGRVIFGNTLLRIPVAAGVYAASTDTARPDALFGIAAIRFSKVIWEAKNKYNKEHNAEPYTPYIFDSHTPVPIDSPVQRLTKKDFDAFVSVNQKPSAASSVAPASSVASVDPVGPVTPSTGEGVRAVENAK
jgi:hypothetical protein